MKRFFVALMIAIAVLLPSIAGAAWKAGVATAKITPRKMIWMAGYASRSKPAERVEQELFGKVLLLEGEQGNQLFIITTDLIGVPRWLRDGLLARGKKAWDLRPDQLLINASHTHSGPELRTLKKGSSGVSDSRVEDSLRYARELEDKLFAAMERARADLSEATIQYSSARAGFAMNRRWPNADGTYSNRPYPDGPIDHSVPVLRVMDAAGKKLRAVVFGYACHNTTLGFYYFTGDYAGYAQEYFEQDHPGVTAMFMMGCGGDQNPYPRRKLDLAQKHGRSLATAIEAALEVKPQVVTGALRTRFADVPIRYATQPDREELEKRTKDKNRYESAYAKRLLSQLDQEGKLPTEYPCPVQVVGFGKTITFVAIGGEVVVDYSLRLKAEIPGEVWVAGYSNDVFAYLASKRVIQEGGYEGGGAMKYFTSFPHPSAWDESVEDVVIDAVHRLRKE
jgi:neutral ceramidase